jgi:hypothetical protein
MKARSKISPLEFLWRFWAARMNPEKFPTGIAEQATLRCGICAGFWSPKKVVA